MIKHEILNGPEFQQEVDKIVAEKLSPINLKISTLEGKITTIEEQTFKNISELTTDVNFISVNNRFVSTAIEFEETETTESVRDPNKCFSDPADD